MERGTAVKRRPRGKHSGLEAQQALLDCCQEAVLLVDREGYIMAANLAASAWLDRATPELTGVHLSELEGDPGNVEELQASLPDLPVGQRLTALWDSPGNERDAGIRITVSRIPHTAHGRDRDIFLLSARPESRSERLLADAQADARSVSERVENLSLTLAEVKRQLVERTVQLAEQRNMIQVVLRGIGDGLLVFDDEGRLTDFNELGLELLGLDDRDLTGQALKEVCPQLHNVLGGWESVQFGLTQPRVDLITVSAKDLRASTAPLRWDGDTFLGCVVVLADRTKEAEVDRLKSDLIGIVSHELRSPLTAIKGYVDLIATEDIGAITSRQKDYLDIVTKNANRLATLIEDMLDLSRIESGKLQMTFGKVDVRYLVDFCVLTLRPEAEKKKQTFLAEIADPELDVCGDVDRLQQALMNLAANAIKYTPDGGNVALRAYREGDTVKMAAVDDGLGISEENQAHLFEKFFRVKGKSTRGIGGTGLGLCITKSIVEAHDGRIEVESEEGQGSTFTVILPTYETSPLQ